MLQIWTTSTFSKEIEQQFCVKYGSKKNGAVTPRGSLGAYSLTPSRAVGYFLAQKDLIELKQKFSFYYFYFQQFYC